MKFATPLIEGRLIRRYNRFLADVDLGGETVVAHCPNPGSMMGLKDPGLPVWLEPNDDPRRKLRYAWRIARKDGAWVGIDTATPNRVVKEALQARAIPTLAAYGTVRPEQKYGTNSRIDFLLTEHRLPDCYVEVKNVHLLRTGSLAEFPDSVTSRGAKHLGDLADVVTRGHRGVMLYVVQYEGCTAFTLAEDLDPAYAAAFHAARAAGVEAICHICHVRPEAITLGGPLPVQVT
ncbi:MAG: DNA/RNA nuclease SfsA [Shimia sp.]